MTEIKSSIVDDSIASIDISSFDGNFLISGITRSKVVTVMVNTKIANSLSYSISIRINGDGYSDVFTGTATSVGSSSVKTFTFNVFSRDSVSKIPYVSQIIYNSETKNAKGNLYKIDKDSFFDIVVEVANETSLPLTFNSKGSVSEAETTYSKTIKVKATVN